MVYNQRDEIPRCGEGAIELFACLPFNLGCEVRSLGIFITMNAFAILFGGAELLVAIDYLGRVSALPKNGIAVGWLNRSLNSLVSTN